MRRLFSLAVLGGVVVGGWWLWRRMMEPAASPQWQAMDSPVTEASAVTTPATPSADATSSKAAESTAKKPTAKKTSAKKSTAKKSTAKKSSAKKSTAKKSTVKQPAADSNPSSKDAPPSAPGESSHS